MELPFAVANSKVEFEKTSNDLLVNQKSLFQVGTSTSPTILIPGSGGRGSALKET